MTGPYANPSGAVAVEDDTEYPHELVIDFDGDGWNEPMHESGSCSCGADLGSWTQRDPQHTGQPQPEDWHHAHARHMAEVMAAAGLASTVSPLDRLVAAAQDVLADLDAVRAQIREEERAAVQASFDQRLADVRAELGRHVAAQERRAERAEAAGRAPHEQLAAAPHTSIVSSSSQEEQPR